MCLDNCHLQIQPFLGSMMLFQFSQLNLSKQSRFLNQKRKVQVSACETTMLGKAEHRIQKHIREDRNHLASSRAKRQTW